MRFRNPLLVWLALSVILFSCNPEDDKDDNTKGSKKTFIHVLNDLSQYRSEALDAKREQGLASYLDFKTKNQYMTQSYASPENLHRYVAGVSVFNVFLNMEHGKAYDAQDMAVFDAVLKKGRGLALYAMGNGAESSMVHANALANKYGFSYVKGDVNSLEGGVKAYNGGFYLNLNEPSKWEILLKGDGKPVVAVRKAEKGMLLASGVDVFSMDKHPANVELFQKIIKKLSAGKSSPAYTKKVKPIIDYEYRLSVTKAIIKANKYRKDALKSMVALYETEIGRLEKVMGVSKKAGELSFVLLSHKGKPVMDGDTVYMGAYYAGFPKVKTVVRDYLIPQVYKKWTLPHRELLEPEAFSNYVVAKVAEKRGDTAPMTGIKKMMAQAKADPLYKECDPVTMSSEQLKKYSQNLRFGKFYGLLYDLEQEGKALKTPVDLISQYYKTKRKKLPSSKDFVFTAHDFAWLMEQALGKENLLASLKTKTGYGFDVNKVRTPSAYKRKILDTKGWEASSAHSFTSQGMVAQNLLDGKKETIWHTSLSKSVKETRPHVFTINMKKAHKVMGFRFLPWQHTNYGDIATDLEVYVSMDGKAWGEPVAKYTRENKYVASWQEIYCEEFKRAQYVQVRIKKMYRKSGGGNPKHDQSNMAEFRVYSDGKTK